MKQTKQGWAEITSFFDQTATGLGYAQKAAEQGGKFWRKYEGSKANDTAGGYEGVLKEVGLGLKYGQQIGDIIFAMAACGSPPDEACKGDEACEKQSTTNCRLQAFGSGFVNMLGIKPGDVPGSISGMLGTVSTGIQIAQWAGVHGLTAATHAIGGFALPLKLWSDVESLNAALVAAMGSREGAGLSNFMMEVRGRQERYLERMKDNLDATDPSAKKNKWTNMIAETLNRVFPGHNSDELDAMEKQICNNKMLAAGILLYKVVFRNDVVDPEDRAKFWDRNHGELTMDSSLRGTIPKSGVGSGEGHFRLGQGEGLAWLVSKQDNPMGAKPKEEVEGFGSLSLSISKQGLKKLRCAEMDIWGVDPDATPKSPSVIGAELKSLLSSAIQGAHFTEWRNENMPNYWKQVAMGKSNKPWNPDIENNKVSPL